MNYQIKNLLIDLLKNEKYQFVFVHENEEFWLATDFVDTAKNEMDGGTTYSFKGIDMTDFLNKNIHSSNFNNIFNQFLEDKKFINVRISKNQTITVLS